MSAHRILLATAFAHWMATTVMAALSIGEWTGAIYATTLQVVTIYTAWRIGQEGAQQ